MSDYGVVELREVLDVVPGGLLESLHVDACVFVSSMHPVDSPWTLFYIV